MSWKRDESELFASACVGGTDSANEGQHGGVIAPRGCLYSRAVTCVCCVSIAGAGTAGAWRAD